MLGQLLLIIGSFYFLAVYFYIFFIPISWINWIEADKAREAKIAHFESCLRWIASIQGLIGLFLQISEIKMFEEALEVHGIYFLAIDFVVTPLLAWLIHKLFYERKQEVEVSA